MPVVSKDSPNRRPAVPAKKLSVLDRISPIGFDDDEGIKLLLYGTSGSGKTTLWATFPGPILAILCSGGDNPGELRSIDTPEYRKKVSQVALHKSDEMTELINFAKGGEFNTVVLDHITGFQDFVLKEILGLDEIPIVKGWGSATQQQYGQCVQQCKEYLSRLLSLKCNVVVVGQERQDKLESSQYSEILTPTVGVAAMPSLANWLNPACDYVLQTFKRPKMIETTKTIGKGPTAKEITTTVRGEGIEYCVRTAPHDVFTTKFRVPKGHELPPEIVDCDYEKIMALIRGE